MPNPTELFTCGERNTVVLTDFIYFVVSGVLGEVRVLFFCVFHVYSYVSRMCVCVSRPLSLWKGSWDSFIHRLCPVLLTFPPMTTRWDLQNSLKLDLLQANSYKLSSVLADLEQRPKPSHPCSACIFKWKEKVTGRSLGWLSWTGQAEGLTRKSRQKTHRNFQAVPVPQFLLWWLK